MDKEREKHFIKVLNFFKDKTDQLLIVNIERKGYENAIIKFLNKINTDNEKLCIWCHKTKNLETKNFTEIEYKINLCLKK